MTTPYIYTPISDTGLGVNEAFRLISLNLQRQQLSPSFPTYSSEPERLFDGLTVVADGVNWDPGQGEGLYIYLSGSWEFLGAQSSITIIAANAIDDAGDGTVEGDTNATDFTPQVGTTFLPVNEADYLLIAHKQVAYTYVGPRPVNLGFGGDYVSTATDYVPTGTNDHTLLVNKDATDQHPMGSITGLLADQTRQDDALTDYASGAAATYVAAGYGSIRQETSVGISVGAGWTTIPFSTAVIPTPKNVEQDTTNNSLHPLVEGIVILTAEIVLSHDESNQGRVLNVRIHDLDDNVTTGTIPYAVARNQPGSNIPIQVMGVINADRVGDNYVVQVQAGSGSFSSVSVEYANFLMTYISEGSIGGSLPGPSFRIPLTPIEAAKGLTESDIDDQYLPGELARYQCAFDIAIDDTANINKAINSGYAAYTRITDATLRVDGEIVIKDDQSLTLNPGITLQRYAPDGVGRMIHMYGNRPAFFPNDCTIRQNLESHRKGIICIGPDPDEIENGPTDVQCFGIKIQGSFTLIGAWGVTGQDGSIGLYGNSIRRKGFATTNPTYDALVGEQGEIINCDIGFFASSDFNRNRVTLTIRQFGTAAIMTAAAYSNDFDINIETPQPITPTIWREAIHFGDQNYLGLESDTNYNTASAGWRNQFRGHVELFGASIPERQCRVMRQVEPGTGNYAGNKLYLRGQFGGGLGSNGLSDRDGVGENLVESTIARVDYRTVRTQIRDAQWRPDGLTLDAHLGHLQGVKSASDSNNQVLAFRFTGLENRNGVRLWVRGMVTAQNNTDRISSFDADFGLFRSNTGVLQINRNKTGDGIEDFNGGALNAINFVEVGGGTGADFRFDVIDTGFVPDTEYEIHYAVSVVWGQGNLSQLNLLRL